MSEESRSESETDGESEKSSSDDQVNDIKGGNEGISAYEKQRLERIKENRARLEALRLPSLASSLLGSVEKKRTRKGKEKKKEDEDEEYKPSEDDKIVSSSGEEEEEEEGEENAEDEEFQPFSSRGSVGKGKVKQSKSNIKKNPGQKHVRKIDFIDDEESLQQAIALSLAESSVISGAVPCDPPQNCRTDVADVELKERKGRNSLQETDKLKKRRKFNTNRVQITEDQVIIHFFQFDEAGKGGITVKDLQRVAVDHDFPWSDKEIADMIRLFDNDGDGRLNLDDFRRILHRCNVIKG